MDRASPVRRFLIAAGTEHYTHFPDLEPLRSVPDDLTTMERLFCQRLGYQRVLPHLALDPDPEQLQQGISGWLNAADRTPGDVLVIYYSGHAIVSGRHYLLCRDSKEHELTATAIATEDLMWLAGGASPVRHILVVLDTCYGGDGVRDLTRSTARNGQNLVAGRGQSGLWFLAAARPQEEALESVFAEALESVASSLGAGSSQPYLSLDSVVSGINAIFERRMLQQRADLGAQDVMTLPPFIDNPDYDPDRAVGLDTDGRHRQAAAWREDRDAHWDPRSRGVPRATDPGRYFWAGSGH